MIISHLPHIFPVQIFETFWLASAVLVALGTVLHVGGFSHPIFSTLFLFGKCAPTRSSWLTVPKRLFFHFYVTAFVCSCFALLSRPNILHIFMLLNSLRRMHECLMIEVASESRMSVIHYLYGHMFYAFLPLAIYQSKWNANAPPLPLCVMLTCQFVSHMSCRQLAQVRKDKPGCVHGAPTGCMFRWLSCPHYVAEMAYYASILAIIRSSYFSLYSMLFLFVLVNQTCSILLAHRWYRVNFPEWTRTRFMLIPGLF